jgi:hypothetical protein
MPAWPGGRVAATFRWRVTPPSPTTLASNAVPTQQKASSPGACTVLSHEQTCSQRPSTEAATACVVVHTGSGHNSRRQQTADADDSMIAASAEATGPALLHQPLCPHAPVSSLRPTCPTCPCHLQQAGISHPGPQPLRQPASSCPPGGLPRPLPPARPVCEAAEGGWPHLHLPPGVQGAGVWRGGHHPLPQQLLGEPRGPALGAGVQPRGPSHRGGQLLAEL